MQRYTTRLNTLVDSELGEQVKEICSEQRTHISDFIRQSIASEVSRVKNSEGQGLVQA